MFMDPVSYLGNSLRLFLGGRSFSSDINAAKSMGLQPLRPECFLAFISGTTHYPRCAFRPALPYFSSRACLPQAGFDRAKKVGPDSVGATPEEHV